MLERAGWLGEAAMAEANASMGLNARLPSLDGAASEDWKSARNAILKTMLRVSCSMIH